MTGPDKTMRVTHWTRYVYDEPVSLSLHRAFLTPRETDCQRLLTSGVKTDPQALPSSTYADYYGNRVTLFTIDTPHKELRVEAKSELSVRAPDARAGVCGLALEEARRRIEGQESGEELTAYEFAFDSPFVARRDDLARYALESFGGQTDLIAGVADLMHRIHAEFRYDPTLTTAATPAWEVFLHRGGVCQDFAHLMIGCLRSLGVAARYVSGYLVPAPGVIGAQASHAWISVYCPGAGWRDFDPTNDVEPSESHITLAWGRDYSDVSPFRGVVVGGGDHEVTVEVEVWEG